MTKFLLALCSVTAVTTATAAELDRVKVADDGKGFVLAESGEPFLVWGVNYDHDGEGRLIEDYWHQEWDAVAGDFAEIKKLGANVVRVHLQFGKFMKSADEPNEKELAQLGKLVALAEETGLYLDVTGLGCYHKADVPAWYDDMNEKQRWAVQEKFWEAVAKACAGSPAVFCYDLMNEPVSPAGKGTRESWLGPAFAGKHFVQRISIDQADRPRSEIAKQWIDQLVKAIRQHDQQTMITVGLVPWSLERKGLQSGFVPEKIAENLDFIAVHIYPEKGKVDEALDTLRGFDVGKPIVVEETFPLKCSSEELLEFVNRSKGLSSGWVSFYWGQSPEQLRETKTFAAALTAQWLEAFAAKGKELLEQK